MTTMNPFTFYLFQASQENCVGASLLAEGRIDEAMGAFASALNMLQQLRLVGQTLSGVQVVKARHCSSIDVPFLTNEGVFVYSRAVVFSPDSLSSTSDLVFFSGVVLFNMAIAAHMRGKASGDSRQLQEALVIYENFLTVVAEIPPAGDDTDLVRVAALNNISTIHFELGDYVESRLVIHEIRHSWRHALVADFASIAFGKHDIDGFILNTTVDPMPLAAASA